MKDPIEKNIHQNLEAVLENIRISAKHSNRLIDDIKLVVVSKKQSIEKIQAALNVGIKIFGENYPEEAQSKNLSLAKMDGIEWHMIGHLQSRKIPIVCQYFSFFQSLDNVKHAIKLNEELKKIRKKMKCLLEVNLANEEGKYGWKVGQLCDVEMIYGDIQQISTLPNLEIIGLMAMPPLSNNSNEIRSYVIKLRNIREDLARKFPATDWNQLSIGTSSDYQLAIEEGSTMVRIGEAIFGPRER